MTPSEFEWHQWRLETEYRRGQIGKISFTREMSKMGFGVDHCRKIMAEIDDRKAATAQ